MEIKELHAMKTVNLPNQLNSVLFSFFLAGLLVIAFFAVLVGCSQKTNFLPTPTAFAPASNTIATPTPNETQIAIWSTTPSPMDIPLVWSKEIDLSPELNTDEEYYIIVRKASGESIFYFVGPVPSGYVLNQIPQSILDQLGLGPDDVIVSWEPPSPMRRHPPTQVVIPTINPPYP